MKPAILEAKSKAAIQLCLAGVPFLRVVGITAVLVQIGPLRMEPLQRVDASLFGGKVYQCDTSSIFFVDSKALRLDPLFDGRKCHR